LADHVASPGRRPTSQKIALISAAQAKPVQIKGDSGPAAPATDGNDKRSAVFHDPGVTFIFFIEAPVAFFS
jgi:hypothetical protein